MVAHARHARLGVRADGARLASLLALVPEKGLLLLLTPGSPPTAEQRQASAT
jgi:hypothetical protein